MLCGSPSLNATALPLGSRRSIAPADTSKGFTAFLRENKKAVPWNDEKIADQTNSYLSGLPKPETTVGAVPFGFAASGK
jgi:hypothetical protein